MPIKTTVHVSIDLPAALAAEDVVVIGRTAMLEQAATGSLGLADKLGVAAEAWATMLSQTEGADAGSSAATWAGKRKVVLGVLPDACSRHNSPSRAWAIPELARKAPASRDASVVVVVEDASHALASALAAARGFPALSLKTAKDGERSVALCIVDVDGAPVGDAAELQAAVDGVRLAGRLFDTPPDALTTTAFVEEAKAVAAAVGAQVTVISGTDLRDQGFGGLWGVGRAAQAPPALVALTYDPGVDGARTMAWVGKGIVYDTGGLSIKTKSGMPSMKGDMGGAAAVLGAFQVAATVGVQHKVVAILCLAENAVGPLAIRPDDVLHMRSGKTVEVNNTDAEGRLVLADGVAWACEVHQPDVLVDVATLTGAALVATGKVHAALYSNDEALEAKAVAQGRRVGEPTHPLPYAPELFRKEFRSQLADMRNSVKDRANAQSSCAGQFVGNHLPEDPPAWLHVDMAGPAWDGENRGTGYGVGLLYALASDT